MQIAAKEAKYVSGHSDIPVVIDGTWQKHGHTSEWCCHCIQCLYRQSVLDASILSRFCKCTNKIQNENCKANHFANSGSMKVSGAIEIFQRSESLHGLRYTNFLGNGDARAYKAVNEMQLYGYIGIVKLEYVGYVEKWMGTRLRALKLIMKGEKLSDKKTLDDHGRLADAEIDKLQRYYGLTIRKNTDSINSINSMKRSIWATYFHKASIDAYPQHGLCPTNEDTWCEYNRAITTARTMETADRERLRKANYDILQNSIESRVKKRYKKCILEDTLAEERKNTSYEAAIH
ncbi:uncharacterized protein TNCV_4257191 [Trichonephila clavipes]|nr:uncharacterized protein TNCV_4257191 [Trichonephila clavipes]